MKLVVIFSLVLVLYYVKAMPYNNNKDKNPQISNDDDMAVEINDENGVKKTKRSTNNKKDDGNDDQGDNNDNQGENDDNQGDNNDNQGENDDNQGEDGDNNDGKKRNNAGGKEGNRKKGNQQMPIMIKRNKRELGDKDVMHGESVKDKMQNATKTVGKEANKVLEKAGDKLENKDDKKGDNKSGAKDANKDGNKKDDKKEDDKKDGNKKEDDKKDDNKKEDNKKDDNKTGGGKKEDDKKGDKKKEDDKNGSAGTPGNTFKGGKSNIQSNQKGNDKNDMKSRERRYTPEMQNLEEFRDACIEEADLIKNKFESIKLVDLRGMTDPKGHCFINCLQIRADLYDDKDDVPWENVVKVYDLTDNPALATMKKCVEHAAKTRDKCARGFNLHKCIVEKENSIQDKNQKTS